MERKILQKLAIAILLSIAGSGIAKAQSFGYKTHNNSSIADYSMPYRLFVPAGYDPNVSYPLVLFLHGAGERGTDNNAQLTANKGATLWAETANQTSYPCFVVAPQCPNDKQWVNTNWSYGSYSSDEIPISTELTMVKDILDTLETKYNIDTGKLYLTGLSMGGYGTWDFIVRYPGMFRAAIPICGAGDPSKASLLKNLPLRVFHSSDDGVVPVSGSREMVNAINQFGSSNRGDYYTEYTNQGHFSWVNAYNTEDLVPWLFTSTQIALLCNDSIVPDITINTSNLSTTVNSTIQLRATVTPDDICNSSVFWSSSNPEVATIDQNGFVLCKNGGNATITATCFQGGKTATCEIEVTGNNYKYEAENAKLYGITVYNNHADYSGTGFVAPFWAVGDYVEYNIQKAEAGEQNIILRYSNGYPDDRTISLYVNGEKIRQVVLPNTLNWELWGDRVDKVTLLEGDNVIRYQVDNGDNGMFNIDYIFAATTGTTGNHQLSENNEISLYPNPNSSLLTLSKIQPGSFVRVISSDGKMVSESVSYSEKMTFDVSNWTKGIYIFSIRKDKNLATLKAVVQ